MLDLNALELEKLAAALSDETDYEHSVTRLVHPAEGSLAALSERPSAPRQPGAGPRLNT
jgi:hypothetical protein